MVHIRVRFILATVVAAVLSPANGSGTWTDTVGNSGSFALSASVATRGVARAPRRRRM
jgi:hypothetical protein